MTIPNISTNSLVDQTQLNQIIDTVNGISSKFANTISPIYNTTTKEVVNSYMGTFAIATNRVSDTVTNTQAKTVVSKSKTISFGKTFLAPPLVFASVDFGASDFGAHITGTVVSSVTNSGCTIAVSIYSESAYPKGASFDLSVMAVGLTQL
jgi:hypothetical protein